MPATTTKAIRENQRNLVQALTPVQLGAYPFVEYIEAIPFADWAELNAATCLRTFAIEDLAPYTTPISGDYQSEEVVTQFAVSVAYPVSYRYGQGANGIADVVEQDRLAIERAIGLYGCSNYVSGQNSSLLVDFEIERGDKFWLATGTYEINFRREVRLGPAARQMQTASVLVGISAAISSIVRDTALGASGSLSIVAPSADFTVGSAARSWTTGRDYFGSAFATHEWLIGNTAYSSGYAPNVGTETLADNGSGGLTGQTAPAIVTGGAACGAWDSVDTGDRLESDGTAAGDFNALTEDFAFRMVFQFLGSVPNSEYLLTKFNTSNGGWRVYTSGGEWHFGLRDNSGNNAGVNAANPASGSYADGEPHYMAGWVDASTGTIYTKGDLSAETSASIAAILASTESTSALHVNGYTGSTGLADFRCIAVSVCVGANAQSHYDEAFWNHPPA